MTEPRFDDPDVVLVEKALWAVGGTLVMGPNEAARIAVQALRENNECLLPPQHDCTASPEAPCFHDSHRTAESGAEVDPHAGCEPRFGCAAPVADYDPDCPRPTSESGAQQTIAPASPLSPDSAAASDSQVVGAREAVTIICAGGWARTLAALGKCHHCGAGPDSDGDHTCPCPFHDNDCTEHPTAPASPPSPDSAEADQDVPPTEEVT